MQNAKIMFYNPDQLANIAAKNAERKNKYSFSQISVLGFLGGAFISLGGLLALVVAGGMPVIEAENPGLVKLMLGALFPLGLILVVILGAELFTGNTSYFASSVLAKNLNMNHLIRNWVLVYLWNFIGALFVAYFIAYIPEILKGSQVDFLEKIALAKVNQTWISAFMKGIACNWLVSLAMWAAISSKDISGKILGMWFPVMAFVAMGMEHSIANQFFIPLAIFNGASISWPAFFIDNLIPVTLGNIVGGGVLVGGLYWFVYSRE